MRGASVRIVFVSPEMAPFAKVGGLADVVGSLPSALRRLGHRVSVILPLYGDVPRGRLGLRPTGISLDAWMDGRERHARIWRSRARAVPVYLIESRDYFDERHVYGRGGTDYEDNAARFAFFCRASLTAIRRLGLTPDVVHVHDWQTALVPVYHGLSSGAPQTAFVLTLHNLAYQGVYPREWMKRLALPDRLFDVDGLEFYGQVNLLKGGLVTAQQLTTVSPTYAKEIRTPELGAGLDGVMRLAGSRLEGILNGIDGHYWHPGKDEALARPFASNRLAGKLENKRALCEQLGLSPSDSAPLLGVVGRLDPQKGFELLAEAIPALVERGARIAILGSGREDYLRAFRRLEKRFSGAISANRGYQDALGRRIYAGADLFLMPSRYEPCGLGQMIALRYGALPVVHRTGGLADTVVDLDDSLAEGNGFVFDDYTVEGFIDAVDRALVHFRDEKQWRRWVARGMRQDFSWNSSAKRYVSVYERAISSSFSSSRFFATEAFLDA